MNVATVGLGAGEIFGGGAHTGAAPIVGLGFARHVTEQVAVEGSLTNATLGDHLGFGELQVAALIYTRSALGVRTVLPFLRVGVGVSSGDFLDFPTHPMARVGGGVEYAFAPLRESIPMIGRPGTTFGLRVEADADFVRTGAPGAGAGQYVVPSANARMLAVSVSLVHRF
jgi:hypothetical protein